MKWPEELQFIRNSRLEQRRSNVRIDGKLCIITGTTSGVGEAAAWRFASGGAHLVMVCRNREKAAALREQITAAYPVQVDSIIADFSDLTSVRRAASEILAAYGRIDILIHNVGIYLKRKHVSASGIDEVFCVNHLSPFLMNTLLLERMVASAPSRIIYVNSEGHRFASAHPQDPAWKHRLYTGLRSYGASKSAQLLSIWKFHQLLQGTGVTINAMHPGAVKSHIGHENSRLYTWYASHVLSRFLHSAEISGEALYYLGTDPGLEHVSGRFFNQTKEEKPASHALGRERSEIVWEKSRELVGLQDQEGEASEV